MQNELYLINDAIYVHIQEDIHDFYYTIYDKESMRQLHQDQIDKEYVVDKIWMGPRSAARCAVCEDFGINEITVKTVPIDILQTLRNIQSEPPLDEYPMPDDQYTMTNIAYLGYLKGDLLPVSNEASVGLSQQGFTLHEVTAYGKVKPPAEVNAPGTRLCSSIFAISRKEWEASPTFREAVAERMNHQMERELSFRCQSRDCFAIYQLNHHDPEMRYIRYEPLEYLQKQGQRPQKENYELVYTAPLPDGAGLDTLWEIFNTNHPPDYQHPSMSVSDVIAIKKDGALACYYVDQYSYPVLDDFFVQRPRQINRTKLSGKPSIKAQLAVKPAPSDKPIAKPKDREVR